MTPNSNYPINHFKQYWAEWLDEQALEKFGEWGYYSMDLKLKNGKALPAGSKVIAYNTTTCDTNNFNLVDQREDPAGQYEWLSNELATIEKAGGVAILLGHIDPVGCMHEWGTRFRALMERYQHIVRFGMQGHVHMEYFSIFNSMTSPDKQVMTHNVAGSLTPLYSTGTNPTFMTLDLDAETLLPVNK